MLPATFSDWRHLSWVDLFRPLGLDEKEIRDRSSTWLRLVGRRSSTLTRAQAEAFIASFGRRLAPTSPPPTPKAPGAPSRSTTASSRRTAEPSSPCWSVSPASWCSSPAPTWRTSSSPARWPALASSPCAPPSVPLASRCCAPWSSSPSCWPSPAASAPSSSPCGPSTGSRSPAQGDNGVGVVLTFDWRVLGWAFGACLFTALAFGVAPALFALRLDLNSTLKSGSRGTTGDRGHQTLPPRSSSSASSPSPWSCSRAPPSSCADSTS